MYDAGDNIIIVVVVVIVVFTMIDVYSYILKMIVYNAAGLGVLIIIIIIMDLTHTFISKLLIGVVFFSLV